MSFLIGTEYKEQTRETCGEIQEASFRPKLFISVDYFVDFEIFIVGINHYEKRNSVHIGNCCEIKIKDNET